MTTVRLRTTGNEQTILTATCSMHSLLLSRTTNEAFGIEGLCAKLCVLQKTGTFSEHVKQKVNPNYQSYPFPLSFARSRESKGCFDQGGKG